MSDAKTETYKDWTIKLTPDGEKCATYRITLINPQGKEVKHVPMGGDTEKRAFERGREMVDMEIKLA